LPQDHLKAQAQDAAVAETVEPEVRAVSRQIK
jgi:hypothetical protein